jgi:tol-pal system protein YbgF
MILRENAMKYFAVILLSCVFTLGGCVAQQDLHALDSRISRLERKNLKLAQANTQFESRLDSDMTKRERQVRDQLAGMSAEMDRLNEEIRLIRGMLEETDYKLKSRLGSTDDQSQVGAEKLEKTLDRLAERLTRIERYLNLEMAEKKPATTSKSSEQQAPVKLSTDMELYKAAKQSLEDGDVEIALERFKKLVSRYPNSSVADNAQFWIGEIFYREKWYDKAIIEYDEVIKKYPKGNKVQAALLKQGLSFSNKGDKTHARLILQELIKKYPQSTEAKIAQKKLKEL